MTTISAMNPEPDLTDYRWLVEDSRAGELLLELADDSDSTVELSARLRKSFSAARARLLMEQAALRRRARAKFSAAERMFFTARSLEQATDEVTADYKAAQFPPGPMFDLCCGIGGDLLSLAGRGRVVGVDRDPIAALLAEANLRAVHGKEAFFEVRSADAAECDLRQAAAWHIDPDRRPGGRRSVQLEHHQPGLPVLLDLLKQCPKAAVKIAPAAEIPDSWQTDAQREWISRDGGCRQQVAWLGELARHPGRRAATILRRGERRTLIGSESTAAPTAERILGYLYEPDAAVLAANLVGALAWEHGLARLSPQSAYLTGEELCRDLAMDAFEVQGILPLRRKQLRAYLRQRGVGSLEVKKRGALIDPEKLRREVIAQGDNQATLLAAIHQGKSVAVIAQRVKDHV